MRRLSLVLVAILLAPSGLASSENDAGRGVDAPNNRNDAWLLTPGEYEGLHSDSVDIDWYRFTLAPMTILRVTSTAGIFSLEESDGTVVGQAGRCFTDAPDTLEIALAAGGDAFLKMAPYCAFGETYSLNASTRPVDDGETGTDAPDTSSAAATRPLGAFTTGFHHRNDVDWYRVEAPTNRVFRLDVKSVYQVSLSSTAGTLLAGGDFSTKFLEAVVPFNGVVLVRIGGPQWNLAYSFNTSVRPTHDISLTEFTIEPLEGDASAYRVRAAFTNKGEISSTLVPWRFETKANLGTAFRNIANGTHAALAPGELAVVEAIWDATGQAGRINVSIILTTSKLDANPNDNSWAKNQEVLMPFPPWGLDVLNAREGCTGLQSDGRTHRLACNGAILLDES